MKFFPLFEQIIQFVLGLKSDVRIKEHWLLYPGRAILPFVGCLVFWVFLSLLCLGLLAIIIMVHDMMNYLIGIAVGSREKLISFRRMRIIVQRYKEIQILVRKLNNFMREYAGRWLMCLNILSILLTYAAVRYCRTMEFLYIVYMPFSSLLLNVALYICLGLIAELALFPERVIRECGKRVRNRKNMRVLNSLYRFRLKLDYVNIHKSFITAYFKNCLDNTATLLLSTR